MSARDVIARACADPGSFVARRYEHETVDQWRARAVEHALTAAGYTILGPDEIHAPSLERLEELESVLAEIRQWCEAYPISVFPEPDFAKVRELLAAGGITLDAVSASNMRHVVNSISKIIDAAALRELMKEQG